MPAVHASQLETGMLGTVGWGQDSGLNVAEGPGALHTTAAAVMVVVGALGRWMDDKG